MFKKKLPLPKVRIFFRLFRLSKLITQYRTEEIIDVCYNGLPR